MKPNITEAAGKYLHVEQNRGVSPYDVQQAHITYGDLPEGDFIPARPAWGATYRVEDTLTCNWGSCCFLIEVDGQLTYKAENWDTSD